MPTLEANGHTMYYELHGPEDAPKAVCMGGWGTFCHGKSADAPRSLMQNYRVAVFDYRGIGDSTDDLTQPATMQLFASDLAAMLDHLEWSNVHIVGMIGMGACVGQELAIARPELVRSLLMTGTWAYCDAVLADQLTMMLDVHREMGFAAFQLLAAQYSFAGDFYNANRDRLLGPNGAWGDLNNNYQAQARLIEACLAHDTRDRLGQITAPSLVLHAGCDPITTERHTRVLEELIPGCEGVYWPEATHVPAGKEMKTRFSALVDEFLRKN